MLSRAGALMLLVALINCGGATRTLPVPDASQSSAVAVLPDKAGPFYWTKTHLDLNGSTGKHDTVVIPADELNMIVYPGPSQYPCVAYLLVDQEGYTKKGNIVYQWVLFQSEIEMHNIKCPYVISFLDHPERTATVHLTF